MASTDSYTTPLIQRDWLEDFLPPTLNENLYMLTRNKPENQKKREDGRIYGGDVFWKFSGHDNLSDVSNPSVLGRTGAVQCTVEMLESEKVGCILAVPRKYATYNATLETGNEWARCYWNPYIKRLEDNGNTAYSYFFVFNTNYSNPAFQNIFHVKRNPKPDSSYGIRDINTYINYTIIKDISGTYADGPQIGGSHASDYVEIATANLETNDNISSWCLGSQALCYRFAEKKLDGTWDIQINRNMQIISEMYGWGSFYNNQIYAATPYPSWMYDNETINKMATSTVNAITAYPEIVPTVWFKELKQYSMQIGQFIFTGFPVFTVDRMSQMWKYFAGEEWESENDVDFPPSDWSTDWDIYIKGAQRPDIYITMRSDKVDAWLNNLSENKSGVTKSEIAVEYRYPQYSVEGANWSEPVSYSDSYILKDWTNDHYNITRNTSYTSNIELNYPLLLSEVMMGEFTDGMIDSLYPWYAQLQFRLVYGDYKSTWCKYEIGVIGSPTVPDFVKMHNIGEQADTWQDDSTVTLHYDELPPDENPYPTPPEPPAPPPQPTYPSPSENGIGLLTTTYNMTASNIQALGRFMWGNDTWINKLKALNFSPIENVVGIKIMPIAISGTPSVVYIGNVDTNINGDIVTNAPIYTLGEVTITGRYQNFLDYKPYTSMLIFLPFVGFVELDPQFVTNKTLKVMYSYDLITGLCNAMLFVNDVYVESHQGNCGVDIPLVASNRAQLEVGLATSLASTAIGLAATPTSSATVGAVSGVLQDVSSYATGLHSQRQGGYSPTLAWTETRECFIVVETPNAAYPLTYEHDYGKPCMATYSISQLTGFTVCDQTVDLSGISGATEKEKEMIKSILTNGFYA